MKTNYLRRSIVVFFVGIGLSIMGIHGLVKGKGAIVLNWRMQPEVANGAFPLLVGIGFMIGGGLMFLKRKQLTKEESIRRKNEGQERKKNFSHIR